MSTSKRVCQLMIEHRIFACTKCNGKNLLQQSKEVSNFYVAQSLNVYEKVFSATWHTSFSGWHTNSNYFISCTRNQHTECLNSHFKKICVKLLSISRISPQRFGTHPIFMVWQITPHPRRAVERSSLRPMVMIVVNFLKPEVKFYVRVLLDTFLRPNKYVRQSVQLII